MNDRARWSKAGAGLLRFLSVWVLPLVSTTGTLYAQGYPTKPIRIVTTSLAGGNDIVARLLAQGLTPSLGQQVIVENRPAGVIPGQIVSAAQPDGYTLLVAGGSFTITPLLQKSPYDVIRDFLPISIVATQPNVLVVHPSLPAKSVSDLIAYAKSKPGELSYAATGVGSSTHLTAELFKQMAGIDMMRINYKVSGQAITELIGGQVQLMFPAINSVSEQAKAGKLKALAVTSTNPSVLLPGVPTVAASGLPGYESVVITSLFAPAKTPRPIISRLNQETLRYLNDAATKEKFLNIGAEAAGSSPEALVTTIKSEMVRMGKVIKEAGISID